MLQTTRKWVSISLLILISPVACSRPAPFRQVDKQPSARTDAPFDPPNTYPEWAFDGPQYVKPVQELTPKPKAKAGDPLHYFTKDRVVMIRQPAGYTPQEIPRVAIWWSDNNGFRWQRAGYFGREQSYFPFEAPEDGDYGVRFVGPNQEQALQATAFPERVYHVDTTLPEVEVSVEPEQTWYNVGQTVTVSWQAEDYHLIELPVTLTAMLDFTADESKPLEIQKGLAKEGSITYQLPAEALNHELRFRVDALDRANNLGIAYSFALQVVSEPVDQKMAARHGGSRHKFKKPAVSGIDDTTSVVASINPERVAANPSTKVTSTVDPMIGEPASSDTKSESIDAGPIFPPDMNENKVIEGATSGEQEDEALPLMLRPGSREDITQGNGLLIPLPATVNTNEGQVAVAHPWRMLVSAVQSPLKTIWALPSADFVQKNPALRNLFLAGGKLFRPMGEPGEQASHVAMDRPER